MSKSTGSSFNNDNNNNINNNKKDEIGVIYNKNVKDSSVTAKVAEEKDNLSVTSVSINYNTKNGILKAVEDISFQLSTGQAIGIVGESGSGKSTLGQGLMRSLPENGWIYSGGFTVDNKDLFKISEKDFDKKIRWKKISMVFQGSMNSLDPVFTVENQMREILFTHDRGQNKNIYNQKIEKALTDVGLDPQLVRKKYPHELSGGMKQRIVIANALLLDPHILIADEPTTALDVIIQSQIMKLFKKLKDDKKMKIIIITHDLSIISGLVDKMIIMYAGQAVEISDTKTIFQNPLHPYTQALIQSLPKLNSTTKSIKFIKGDPPNLLKIGNGCRFKDRCPKAFDKCNKDPPIILKGNDLVKCWLYK